MFFRNLRTWRKSRSVPNSQRWRKQISGNYFPCKKKENFYINHRIEWFLVLVPWGVLLCTVPFSFSFVLIISFFPKVFFIYLEWLCIFSVCSPWCFVWLTLLLLSRFVDKKVHSPLILSNLLWRPIFTKSKGVTNQVWEKVWGFFFTRYWTNAKHYLQLGLQGGQFQRPESF